MPHVEMQERIQTVQNYFGLDEAGARAVIRYAEVLSQTHDRGAAQSAAVTLLTGQESGVAGSCNALCPHVVE